MRTIKHPRIDQIDLTDVMHALADPARVEIVRRLAAAAGPLACNDIVPDRPKSTMSHHFKILRDAGILHTEVEGTEHKNRLRLAELEKKFPGLMKALLRAIR
jgi:DNA-binding transcriptional ArsR family regulator